MKKVVTRVLVVLVVLVVVILVAVHTFLGSIIKTGVEKVGPDGVGVPVTLDRASASLIKGNVKLSGFVIGNPEGYTSDYAFSLGTFTLDMDPRSVTADDLVIREVVIDSSEIIYELSLKGSNLRTIMNGLKKEESPSGQEEEAADDEAAGSGKRVQITDLYVRNAKVKVTSPLLLGGGATLALAEIHLHNVGKDSGGISMADATELLLGTVLKSVVLAVKDSGNLAGDIAGVGLSLAEDLTGAGLDIVGGLGSAGIEAGTAVLGGGVDAAKALTEGGGKAVKALGEGAGAAIEDVGEGAGKTVEAAGKGVEAVGSAAAEGADKVLKGVGSLLGNGEKDEDEKAR